MAFLKHEWSKISVIWIMKKFGKMGARHTAKAEQFVAKQPRPDC